MTLFENFYSDFLNHLQDDIFADIEFPLDKIYGILGKHLNSKKDVIEKTESTYAFLRWQKFLVVKSLVTYPYSAELYTIIFRRTGDKWQMSRYIITQYPKNFNGCLLINDNDIPLA